MARTKTFAEKVIKKGAVFGKVCPTCGEEIQFLKRVEPIRKSNGSIGFSDQVYPYCKCNVKELQEK
jgi:hypothetical protein